METDSKKDTLVKYEFNTVDEQGNTIMDIHFEKGVSAAVLEQLRIF